MACADDMELAHLFVPEFSRLLHYLLGSEEKGAFLFRTALAIRAKEAPVDTNVGVVDVQIIYVKDPAGVFRLIDFIGQPA